MKKVLAFLICALLILSASACGSLEVKEDNNSVNSSSEYSEILINTNLLSSINTPIEIFDNIIFNFDS